jgi:hypothetical protein
VNTTISTSPRQGGVCSFFIAGDSEGYHSDNPELCLEDRDLEAWEDVESEDPDGEDEARDEDEDEDEDMEGPDIY